MPPFHHLAIKLVLQKQKGLQSQNPKQYLLYPRKRSTEGIIKFDLPHKLFLLRHGRANRSR